MKTQIKEQAIQRNESCTELAFVVDRSGSMAGSEESVVSSVNEMIKKQRQNPIGLNVHITVFDNQSDVLQSGNVESITDLKIEDVKARNSTALLDAIGLTFGQIDPQNDKTGVMVIVTDGMENASTQFNYSQIQNLIKEKMESGWQVMYLGAGLHESKDAEDLGIRKEDTIFMSKNNIMKNMDDVCGKIIKLREENTWHDELNRTYDWDILTKKERRVYPDIAYVSHEQHAYIVDTGSPTSFQCNGEILLPYQRYAAQRYDLMGKLRGHTLRECEGLIGNDILLDYRIYNDPNFDEVHLASRELSVVDAMHAIPFRLHYGIPTIKLKVEGKVGDFFLDTGSSTTYVRPGFVSLPAKRDMVEYAPMCGEFNVSIVDAKLEILPIGYIQETEIGVFPKDVSDLLLRGIDGILGFDILKQYEFVIDLKEKMFYIERMDNI